MMTIEETGESRKLRECPFCGCTDITIYRFIEDVSSTFEDVSSTAAHEIGSQITCMGCLMTVYREDAFNVDDNVKAWNRRVKG